MRPVTINLATGSDGSVDPRVAPNGTLVRVQNCRIDRQGRLVPRNGYTSLGTGVQGAGTGLVPFDLHNLDGDLVALGNNSSANQTGIRAPYMYVGDTASAARGAWHCPLGSGGTANNTASLLLLPAADGVEVLISDTSTGQTDEVTADCAVTSTGELVAIISQNTQSFSLGVNLRIVEIATGRTVHSERISGSNPRVLAIGTTFYVFYQVGTEIRARFYVPASSTIASGTVAIATATSAAPAPYDVAPFEGSTDFLIAYATATGYTWRRFSNALVQQTTTSVVSLANAPVSICGATGETVSVLNVRTASGAELRTFTTAGALSVGPTNLDTLARVYSWVGLCRVSATQVFAVFHGTAPDSRAQGILATTAAHVPTAQVAHFTRPVTKPLFVEGHVFIWETLGQSTQRTYGLSSWGTGGATNESFLSALSFDGAAKTAFSAATIAHCPQIARAGSAWYAPLITFDPRDKTYRANVVAFDVFSGARRQGVSSGGNLYLTGGVTTVYDRVLTSGLGFESIPFAASSSQSVGGALTLLGTYTYQLVYRVVFANGDVMQSAPSDALTITLTGGNNRTQLTITCPYSSILTPTPLAHGASAFVDVYRTEAGGSIPRFNQAFDMGAPGAFYGPTFVFNDDAADSAIQSGAALYTQGADGSVSGRLPLSFASACRLITESDGKLLLGKLERPSQLQISLENRPGETPGFVNDDLFYVQNPERIEALIAGEDGRRFIFGRSNIRELLGSGPNAAGVGDISEPVEIESRVGCTDWRSVCKSEHGVFFQSSNLGKPRIYLLPRGAATAIDAGEGIRDLLEAFPVITSATRHDEEQLLTFTLQNDAGTDGRLVHLDLKTSGMDPRRGWQGRWIVDRVAAFESGSFPEIVEELEQIIPFASTGSVTLKVPKGKQVGDRHIILIAAQGLTTGVTIPTGYSTILSGATTAGRFFVFERIYSTAVSTAAQFLTTTLSVNATTIVARGWLIRGAHASSPCEVQSLASAATVAPVVPTLTPTWGSAKTLWLTAAMTDSTFALTFGFGIPVWRGVPDGFTRASSQNTSNPSGLGVASLEMATASQQLEAAAIAGATWTAAAGVASIVALLAIRPLAPSGTPVRASTHYKGRLVVCNATDVIQSDASSTADLGTLFIGQEVECADIYPMGLAGAGRHLKVMLTLELLGFCNLTCLCSYDNGATWTALSTFQLHTATGYAIGKTYTIPWTPNRRKIEKVRVKFVVSLTDVVVPSPGATGGVALMQAQLFFEDLAGPARQGAQARGSIFTQ